ncbi:MAG: N-acetylgalactosamine-6-sulfatase, partial [Paludibacter sp.]|nr:N-acetylgalactosamine-6-sulfatase [Paludibacter sp.]
ISFFNTSKNNEKAQDKHKYLYFEFYEEGGKQAIVSENWKYIKLNVRQGAKSKKPIVELYDLSKDLSEQKNIASENPKVVKKLNKYLVKAHIPFPLTSLLKDDGKETDMFH